MTSQKNLNSCLFFLTLVPEVFLEAPEIREGVKTTPEAARREIPLVTLDLNVTFMQTPGSGSDPQARIGWYFLQTRKLI